jgi:hypothetical protein
VKHEQFNRTMNFLGEYQMSALLLLGLSVALIFIYAFIFIAKLFKRCPSNKILVVFGKVGRNQS